MANDKRHPMSTGMNDISITQTNQMTDIEQATLQQSLPTDTRLTTKDKKSIKKAM
jgi:hypothetical protein